MAAVAAAAQNMLLAAHALGFAAKWATGKQAYDATVKAELGLGDDDRIIGFLYLGSYRGAARGAAAARPRRRWSANGRPPPEAERGVGRPGCCHGSGRLHHCRRPKRRPRRWRGGRLSCTEAGFEADTPDFRLCLLLQQTNERLAAVERRLSGSSRTGP